MAITEEMIETNKNTFIELLTNALSDREDCKLSALISKLEQSDFFVAPASTKYHNSFAGGLVDHSLNVYYNMMSMAKSKHLIKTEEDGCIDEKSIAVVALLHDFSKMNYYRKEFRNKKIYSEQGLKQDNGGRFDWVAIEEYSVIPADERFVYASHEITSEYMIRQFVPLTYEESIAVLHHHGGTSEDSIKDNISAIFSKYPLATLLHLADMMSSYVDE